MSGRRESIDVQTAVGEKRSSVVDRVDAPRFDLDLGEAGGAQPGRVLTLLERTRDAPDPRLHGVTRIFQSQRPHVSDNILTDCTLSCGALDGVGEVELASSAAVAASDPTISTL